MLSTKTCFRKVSTLFPSSLSLRVHLVSENLRDKEKKREKKNNSI